jgi:predicted nucleic acid-binding protein
VRRAFVADASVAIGWVHPGQATALTSAMLDDVANGATLEVPALWPLEVANALTVLVRRRKLSDAERQVGLGWLRGLPRTTTAEAGRGSSGVGV